MKVFDCKECNKTVSYGVMFFLDLTCSVSDKVRDFPFEQKTHKVMSMCETCAKEFLEALIEY